MTPVIDTELGAVFVGGVDDEAATAAAEAIARDCSAYSRDDDDECYVDGDHPSCFNCRGRRWVQGGFTCSRGLLRS